MALEKFKVKKGIEISDNQSVGGTSLIPSGTIALWPTDICPDGWIECNGQQLPIGTADGQYNDLYKAITNDGSVFPFGANTDGSGNIGSTHFRVPEMESRIAIGTGTGDGLTTRSLGDWGGLNLVSITNDIISHQHTMAHTHTMSHTHVSPGHDGTPHVSGTHDHSVGGHGHSSLGTATDPHSHNAFFGNTGAPGSAFRMQSTVNAPALNMTSTGDHNHMSGGTLIGDAFNDLDTSGDSLSQTTGSGSGNTTGPSQTNTGSAGGTDLFITVEQSSYSLMYIIKV